MEEPREEQFDVFISHSMKDDSIAETLKHKLQAAGLICWKAPDNIMPGESWPAAITRALASCKTMCLVWSANSVDSPEVAKELTLAMQNGVTVVPFRLEKIEPRGEWLYHLANTHWMDAFPGSYLDHVDKLAAWLKRASASEPHRTNRPTDTAAPYRPRTARRTAYAFACAAVATVATALFFAAPERRDTAFDAQAKQFLVEYLLSSDSTLSGGPKSAKEIAGYFAFPIKTLYQDTDVSPEMFEEAISAYHERWPHRSFTVTREPQLISPLPSPSGTNYLYQAVFAYDLSGPDDRQASGTKQLRMELTKTDAGEIKIKSVYEFDQGE